MLKDRTRGFIGKVGALGITHPSGRQLAMVGTLMATRIMVVGTPDFDLLTGGMVGLDEMVESLGEAVSQQGVVPEAVDIDPDKVFMIRVGGIIPVTKTDGRQILQPVRRKNQTQ